MYVHVYYAVNFKTVYFMCHVLKSVNNLVYIKSKPRCLNLR